MARVILSRSARADLVEIGNYGAERFGHEATDSYQDAIDRAFERLESYPFSGEAKPGFGDGFRCLPCNRHRIIYRVVESTVEIIRILHHSRDVPRHLEP